MYLCTQIGSKFRSNIENDGRWCDCLCSSRSSDRDDTLLLLPFRSTFRTSNILTSTQYIEILTLTLTYTTIIVKYIHLTLCFYSFGHAG